MCVCIRICMYVFIYIYICLCAHTYTFAKWRLRIKIQPWIGATPSADPLGFTGSQGFPIWGPGRWKMDAFSSTLASKSGLVHWSKPQEMVGTVETPKFSRVAEIIQPRGLMFKVWIYVKFGRKWMWLSWQLLPTGFEENGQTDLQFGPAPEQSWEAEHGEFSNKGGPQTIGDVYIYIYIPSGILT